MQKNPSFFNRSEAKFYELLPPEFSKPNLRIKIPVEKDEELEQKRSPIMALLSYLNCFLYKEQTEYND